MRFVGMDSAYHSQDSVWPRKVVFVQPDEKDLANKECETLQTQDAPGDSKFGPNFVGNNLDDRGKVVAGFETLKVGGGRGSSSSSSVADNNHSLVVGKPGGFEFPWKKNAYERMNGPSVSDITAAIEDIKNKEQDIKNKEQDIKKIEVGSYGEVFTIVLTIRCVKYSFARKNIACTHALSRVWNKAKKGVPMAEWDDVTVKGAAERIRTAANKFVVRIAQNEIRVNERVESCIQQHFKDNMTTEKPDCFFIINSEFIVRYFGKESDRSFFMEKAPGKTLCRAIECGDLEEASYSAVTAGNGNGVKYRAVLILAQVLAALAVLHKHGVVHRDAKPSNVMYDPEKGTIKLIDFGVSYIIGSVYSTLPPPFSTFLSHAQMLPFLVSYFSSIEENLCQKAILGGSMLERMDDYSNMMHYAMDVYGIGINSTVFLFGKDAPKPCNPLADEGPNLSIESQIDRNIRNRNNFLARLSQGNEFLGILNKTLPVSLQYTDRQLEFIRSFILWCTDKDPTKRPTAAQASYALEMFFYGADDFEDVKRRALEDRPASPGYFSKQTIEAYKVFGIPVQEGLWL
jgi:serine/threonine protein kinase